MRAILVTLSLCAVIRSSIAQSHDFDFGKVTLRELQMTTYDKDTAAEAVVLREFGESTIDNFNNNNLIFTHHIRMKILKKGGLDYADYIVELRKGERYSEVLQSVEASAFNIEDGLVREVKWNAKNLYTENKNKYRDFKKFAVPNVRVGSVIEIRYVVESPFIQNFHGWEFQSEIPKVKSEYWALMPANYNYNVTLRGYLKLAKTENKLIKDCFTPGGSAKADCTELYCSMENIPAFVEEDYMTATSNFLAAMYFELMEIKYFDGRTKKFSEEWKDVEEQLRRDPKFGVQLKRGGDIVDEKVEQLLVGVTDPLVKAQKIYDFIKGWYRWNDVYGEYSDLGIKKAFESKVGNVGDINLSLIAALKYAGLSAEPVLLSTRQNGLLTEIHPVLSEFNYVIVKLNVNDKIYLLDATEDFLSFGLIPERCLNGRGRVLGEKESYWYELTAPERGRRISVQRLKIDNEGLLRGVVKNTYTGYEAMRQRKIIGGYSTPKEYVDKLSNSREGLTISGYKVENLDNLLKPVVVELEIEMDSYSGEDNFLLNPFLFDRWEKNPFKSSERLYPVDFGVPREEIITFTLEYPEKFAVAELPEKIGLILPNAGGRFLFQVQNTVNTLVMNSSLTINKTVFTADEYHFLKELFGRVVSAQQTELVFKKKM